MMGVGIWAMHFVGMLVMFCSSVAYDVVLTALSVVLVYWRRLLLLHVVARFAG